MLVRQLPWDNETYSKYFTIITSMPLTKNVAKNIRELVADNKKKGKARGAGGKKRSMKQIVAISLSAAGKSKNQKTKKKKRA